MNHKDHFRSRIQEVEERFQLVNDRVQEIALGEPSGLTNGLKDYFKKTAEVLVYCQNLFHKIKDGQLAQASEQVLQEENERYFTDIFPGEYETSYANPDYAVSMLGADYGKLLCFLYTELRAERVFAFEQDLYKMTILHELFLEIYGMFQSEKVTYRQLRETIYWFLYDYAEEWCGWRVRELLDPELSFARDIVMESDLSDGRYLYAYGEYISENERKAARYLASLEQEEIDTIARCFTEGYRDGFLQKGVDLSKKKTVNIRYHIGYERIIRAAILQFREMGLESVIYRSACNTLSKNQNIKIGYVSSSPNEQFEYDHRYDAALYLDKRMVDRKISCMRKMYEELEEDAAGFAGPAFFQVFGKKPYYPINKEHACRLSERQENLSIEYSVQANALVNEFIDANERSFTIIAYPTPEIGEQFEEIFHAINKVNTLDNQKYCKIQEEIIRVLDHADVVKIMGRGKNMTNLTIALASLEDPEKETKFENCLADVNIPVGEVFTSPKLENTNGLLHVTDVYLNGLPYKNLKIWFEDGMITDYSCENFEDPEEGKAFVKENILYNRPSLPMGEFAIGTNTYAYVVAAKYNIMDKLPILIAEKMGPHIAVGDTCYAYSEEVPVFNPDGKEVIARENSRSMLRVEDPKKAYFNCHTDITIPYEEIGRITAIQGGKEEDHHEVPILLDGRFVLEGTMELNDPFREGL